MAKGERILKSFEYADQEVGFREIVIAVASMILGVGIITLPRMLTENTLSSDGWISLLIGSIALSCFAFIAAKLASRFPGQTFLQYASRIISKPIAYVLTVSFGLYALANVAIQMRAVGDISSVYLFDITPMPVVTLIFLLVVVYAVSKPRVGIFRLNMMFFPIVFVIAIGICVLNVASIEWEHARPFLASDWREIFQGSKQIVYSMLGFELVLFYIMYMKSPRDAGKAAVIGVNLILLLYLFVYLSCILVFGREVTQTIVYPTMELAKQIEIPGEFLERFESLFFTIWIMTIFNTSAMAYDIAIMIFHSIIKKGKKIVYLSIFSPIIYLIGMTPPTLEDYFQFGQFVGYIGIVLAAVVPSALLLISKVRGIGKSDSS